MTEKAQYGRHTYRMTVAFNGAAYVGYQRQEDGRQTVQENLERALESLLHQPVKLSTSSRTDAGVHALGLVVSFRTPEAFPAATAEALLNQRLPVDVHVSGLSEAAPDFDAHGSALGKAYVYVLHLGDPSLFLRDTCWSWPEAPALPALSPAVSLLTGRHDFRSFDGRHEDQKTERTIYRAELKAFGPLLCFYISGDGFLYKMVRRIVGRLHLVALGELSSDAFAELLSQPSIAPDDAPVAPPQGLYLKRVFYEKGEWLSDTLDHPPLFY